MKVRDHLDAYTNKKLRLFRIHLANQEKREFALFAAVCHRLGTTPERATRDAYGPWHHFERNPLARERDIIVEDDILPPYEEAP
jgi:hypothetical protein